MFLWKKQPSWMHTFADFYKFLYNKIMDISSLFNRCDVITERYFKGSLKEGTIEDRGSGTGLIVIFDDCSEIPPNFISKFLMLQTKRTSTSIWQINFSPIMKANSQYYALHLVIPLLAIVKQFC